MWTVSNISSQAYFFDNTLSTRWFWMHILHCNCINAPMCHDYSQSQANEYQLNTSFLSSLEETKHDEQSEGYLIHYIILGYRWWKTKNTHTWGRPSANISHCNHMRSKYPAPYHQKASAASKMHIFGNDQGSMMPVIESLLLQILPKPSKSKRRMVYFLGINMYSFFFDWKQMRFMVGDHLNM